ncbi:MAG TPA: DNA primase [Saprospiraceae bacterium]|nr:DNA primase [Saprospiraceae bacterium]
MISQKSIDEIIDTARIEEVVGDFVTLKRRGTNLIGLCPFHNEKTPSFNVNPARNIFKCFGCGQGGDSVQFIMEHDGMSFTEALRYLAAKYKIEIEETKPSAEQQILIDETESLHIINQYAVGFYSDQLFNTDMGKSVGLSYFKQRGFLEETIKKFNLGYSPGERDAFTRNAVKAGYNPDLLKKLGLTTASDNDFFRSRVIFPIHGLSGKISAFAGRTLSSEAFGPKYLNSPESAVYNKSKTLYGLFHAKQAIRKHDECLLVEGYTDVISLHQGGVENVVASSGTSLTVEQIRLIKRYTQNILIVYDGDPAGIKAAFRGIELILEEDLKVKIVLLPDKHDPDSFFKEVGHSGFTEFIENNKKDFVSFRISLAADEIKGDPVKKMGFIQEIVRTLAKIPHQLVRAEYIKEISEKYKIAEQLITLDINRQVIKMLREREEKAEKDKKQQEISIDDSEQPETATEIRVSTYDHSVQEKDLIRVLIHFGDKIFDENSGATVAQYIYNNTVDILQYFDVPLYKLILENVANLIDSGQSPGPDYFLKHQDSEIRNVAMNALQEQYVYSEKWNKPLQTQKPPEENFVKDALFVVRILKYRKFARICKEMEQKMLESKSPEDEIKYLKMNMKLQELKRETGKPLNIIIFGE